MSVTGTMFPSTMFSNAAITNPLFDGSAGRNPLGAINALNTMHFGGAASTNEFVTNAYLQGIGVGPSPFGIGGPPPLKRELNSFFMQGNPLMAAQADISQAGGGFGQSPSIGMWPPSNFDLVSGFQPPGIPQQFGGIPATAQFGGAQFAGSPVGISPFGPQAAASFAPVPTQAQFSGFPGFSGAAPQFAASPFAGAGIAMPPAIPQAAIPQMMPQMAAMPMTAKQEFMQNFWGGAPKFFGGMVQQTAAFFFG